MLSCWAYAGKRRHAIYPRTSVADGRVAAGATLLEWVAAGHAVAWGGAVEGRVCGEGSCDLCGWRARECLFGVVLPAARGSVAQ